MALLCGTEHQCLVDTKNAEVNYGLLSHNLMYLLPETRSFSFGLSQSRLQLLLCHLKIPDMGSSWHGESITWCQKITEQILTAIQQGHFAGLLVGNRKCILEAAVPVTELITSPLLRLDALTADLLATLFVRSRGDHGVEVVVVVAVEVV